jgi:ADP-heptose:LPS heptosyltransferase
MRILALQLKRIGDLVLTTPALAALRAAHPKAHLTLAVHASTAGLLPMIGGIDSAVVFGPGRGWAPWQQVLTGRFDAVLDFTGTDRSALAAAISRAPRRVAFEWLRTKRLRALAFGEFVESSVRERHTVDHYLDLAGPLLAKGCAGARPVLRAPEGDAGRAAARPAAVLHPGTARPEKYWLVERWAEVGRHLIERHGLPIVITTGPDPFEQEHAAAIQSEIGSAAGTLHGARGDNQPSTMLHPPDLTAFASLLAVAPLVVSCDTAAVHLAAAFERPQVALFGPTNPFHWRPRHERAVVISAANPSEPLTEFSPRMKGAPMDRISTEAVCRAIDSLLEAAEK